MSLSVNLNGQSKVPPGFRFHPTEEELLHYYLRKKVSYEKIDLDVIRDIDLNKLEPWDIKEMCGIGSTPQNDWYFFSHKDKKYPTGTRTNRATAAGFWKATGRDKVIYSSSRRIGMRKTLVFYTGRAPHGQKSDWIMHEYRLDDNTITSQDYGSGSNLCDSSQEDGWVVCRVFKKKNYHKVVESPQRSSSAPSIDSTAHMQSSNKNASIHDDQFVVCINGKSCKQETDSLANNTTITHDYNPLQQFISPIHDTLGQDSIFQAHNSMTHLLTEVEHCRDHEHLENWSDVDRLVASQLDGRFTLDHDDQTPSQGPQPSSMAKSNEPVYTSEMDIWSFAQSSSQSSSPDPFYHLSV